MPNLKIGKYLLRIVGGAMILQVIAFYNSYPLIYSDTGTYLYTGFDLFVPKDRPILYGLFIQWFSLKKSLWLVVLTQNLFTSFLIFEVICLFVKKRQSDFFFVTISLLVIGTSIGWYTNQIMPDFFAPLLILSWVWLLFYNDHSLLKKGLVWLLFIVANCTHFSHLFLSSLLIIIIVLAQISPIRKVLRERFVFQVKHLFNVGLLVVLSWVVIPLTNASFNGGFTISKGSHVFLLAHLNEKGILKDILNKHCDSGKLEGCSLCEEKDNLPQDIDNFIWSGDFLERHGGWENSQEQFGKIISISLKEPKFLIANLYYSALYGVSQLAQVETGEGLTSYVEHSAPYGQIAWRFPHELNAYMNSKQNKYGGVNMKFETLNIFHISLILASLFFLFYITRNATQLKISNTHIALIYLVILGVICNSMVTAGLSAPYSRYQSRVIWLIPFISFIMFWLHHKNLNLSKK